MVGGGWVVGGDGDDEDEDPNVQLTLLFFHIHGFLQLSDVVGWYQIHYVSCPPSIFSPGPQSSLKVLHMALLGVLIFFEAAQRPPRPTFSGYIFCSHTAWPWF